MRRVQITATFTVADDVPDEWIGELAAAVAAQVDEPVGGHDASGNELRFEAYDIEISVETS